MRNRPAIAFLYAVPIGVLGGLIGLGGAEFRLPVLAGPLRYPVKQAVPLNLAVSFLTLAAAVATRGGSLTFSSVAPFRYGIGAMIAGAVVAACFGSRSPTGFPRPGCGTSFWYCWSVSVAS